MKLSFIVLLVLAAIAQLAMGITPTPCTPKRGTTKAQCTKMIRECQSEGPLRWTGTGCKMSNGKRYFDGGCQPIDYCGFNCKAACTSTLSRAICKWENGACTNKHVVG